MLQVGDGTTTVVLLAGEFLKEAKPFVEDGVHPQNLIRSYRTACYLVSLCFFRFSWFRCCAGLYVSIYVEYCTQWTGN